ncbi:iron-sulfur cluster assembly scaffold protein [Erythrobacter sp. Alg231-14]|uniref:iron-sulfur cluster assembly scaffold protein n=1 Tax=Erythrobacter sp. Alg231-14 TaxID=1922225 RepID=UPI00307C8DDB
MADHKDTIARPAKLYTPRLLALSADLALFPLIPPYQYSAQARSRTCGSVLDVGLNLDDDACVSAVGLQVTACAIGQSSAAIMAHSIKGRAASYVPNVCLAIEAWLRGDGELPDWPGFDALEPARAHPGRHDALLLPWRGAAKALSTGTVSS